MESQAFTHTPTGNHLVIMITNLNSDINIFSDGSSRGAEATEVEILSLSLPTTTVNYINTNTTLPSGNVTRAYKWQIDPNAPNLSVEERRRIRKAISDKKRRIREKDKLLHAKEMVQQKDDKISKLSDNVSRLEQDFRHFSALNSLLLERKRIRCHSLLDSAVSDTLFDLLDYSATLLVDPLTLEPLAITNNSSDSLSDGSGSVVEVMGMETYLSSPSPTTVNDNDTQFGNGERRNGRRFKWTMNPQAPNLKMELRRSILKAQLCRSQREKEKKKYLHLKETVKQKDEVIAHLEGRITQLEGDNEKLSTDNMMMMENEREEMGDNNQNNRENGLVDSSVDIESFY